MDSKYLAAASAAVDQAVKLTKEQTKQIQALEETLKLLRAKESNAHRFLQEAVKTGNCTENEAIMERAKIKGSIVVAIAETEARIRQIDPGWLSNAKERAENAVAEGSTKVGEVAGNVLRTPIQSAIRFGSSFWGNAKKALKTGNETPTVKL